MKKTVKVLCSVLTLFVLAIPIMAQACPGCAEAANESLARGFNNSILFLMAMPFTIVGGVALCLVVMHRRQQLATNLKPNESPTISKKEEERT